ncbi:MAG TPA: beta-ketoacyl synthase N-terminal-like domain-containing protein [Planctomycetota bacterium]|jgi:hypothetical protein
MSSRPVVITGFGLICPPPLNEALAGRLQAPPQPTPEITAFEVPEGAPAWGFEVLDFSLEKELPNIKSFVDRTSALALGAAKLALTSAGLLSAEQRPGDIGCAYGTTLGCLEAMGIFWNKVKTSNPKFAQPLPFTHGYANSPSSLLCIEFGLRGPAATFSGERLAGMEALLFAHDQIASGAGEIILAGASDSLTQAAYNHLLATGQLSRSGNWDDGIVPGEGAAMIIVESQDSAKKRGARILAGIDGINLLRVDETAAEPPMHVATPPQRTVVLVSTPNKHRGGGRVDPRWALEMPLIAPRYYTGDMLAASPLAGVALGAGILGRCFAGVSASVLPLVRPCALESCVQYAVATGYDTSGTMGLTMLRRPVTSD